MINTIYNIDCLEGMQHLEEDSVDMILCDLPYGQTQNDWDLTIPINDLWKEYLRIVKANAAIILFGQGLFTAELMLSQRKIWRYNLIWDKGTCTGFLNSGKMPLKQHEDILVFYKMLPTYNPQWGTGPKTHNRSERDKSEMSSNNYGDHHQSKTDLSLGHAKHPTSILKFKPVPPTKHLHPTQKPVPLIEYLIKTYSNEGNLVLDNCIGCGTTAVAAIRTGRKFIGFEIDKGFFDIAQDEIKKAREQGKISEWF